MTHRIRAGASAPDLSARSDHHYNAIDSPAPRRALFGLTDEYLMPDAIPLARPNITQAEIDAVTAVLRTSRLSLGPGLKAFEVAFADYTATRHAVACSSGTAALHMVLLGKGIGDGDEVITTPFSFVASANCALMVGATPVFVDIDPQTWNIDPGRIEAAITPGTRAVLAVDVFGQVADMDAIRLITEKHGLVLIEDSCEALGSRSQGRPAGSLGDAGVFGFYPNKQITTGEGGMIVTDDAADRSPIRVAPRATAGSPTSGSVIIIGSVKSTRRWAWCSSNGSTN